MGVEQGRVRDSERLRHGEGGHRSQSRDSGIQRRKLPGRKSLKVIRCDCSKVTSVRERKRKKRSGDVGTMGLSKVPSEPI